MRTRTAVRDLEGVGNKAPPKRYSLRSGPPLQPAARRIPKVTWQGKGAVHSKAQSGNATGKDVAVEKPKQAIVELLEIIRNADYLQQLLSSMDYNYREYPPSQLSKDDIRRGFSKLRDISRSIYRLDSSDEMPKCRTSCRRQDSTEYYSSIPHEFLKKPHPVINTENLVAKELDLLTFLSYIKDMGEDTAISDEEVIVLPKNDNEFLHIQKYLNQSHNDEYRNYEVKDIFRIKRRGEAERIKSFQSSTSTSKSRLLWHGSPVPSYGGILSHGLRVAPIQDPQSGDLLCKGIYFADMSCVSIEHCRSYSTGGEALLLLCEVEVGEYPLEIFSSSLKTGNVTCKSNKHSTFIRGRTGPSQWIDAAEIHESLIGIEMPDPAFDPGDTSYPFAPSNYNKYICYNESQIHIRYLIRIRF